MKLLLDNCVSFRIAHALQAIYPEHEIVSLRERFPENTPDIDWIGSLSEQASWAVITRDLRIRSRPHERAAMDASAIIFFFLANGWRGFDTAETAARLLRWIPKMAQQVELAERGRFEVPINAGSKLRGYRD